MRRVSVMKKLGFEQQGSLTYLVYELEPEDVIESTSMGMLMNNRIPGFAQAAFHQMDNTKRIKYDVTARVSADMYLQGVVNKKRILGVFLGIVRAILSAEDYMIDIGTIQLELGSIFSDVVTADTILICVPVVNKDEAAATDLRTFFRNILFNAQYDENENQDYVARITSYLNGAPSFSISEFKDVLDYLATEPAAQKQSSSQQPSQFENAGASQQSASGTQSVIGRVTDVPKRPAPAAGYSVQNAAPVVVSSAHTVAAHQDPDDEQKQISLFYLLQHYNKENAAIYKTQKEGKKAKRSEKKSEKKAEKQVPKQQKKVQGSPDFSVPGQDAMLDINMPAARESGAGGGFPAQNLSEQHMQQLSQPVEPVFTPVPPPMAAPVYAPIGQQEQPQTSVQYEDTSYFGVGDDDGTVILGQEKQNQQLMPHLLRKRNNERIPINKAIFRLGRDADYNDYCIAENRYVGHSHCHILCKEGEFFVVDDNSKNRTKVNGTVISPGVEVKIAHGSIISLANEEFEFKLF